MILESASESSFLGYFSYLGALFLLILGIIWMIYAFHELTRRKGFFKKKVEEWEVDPTKLLKILTGLGLIIGIFTLIAGISSLILNEAPSLAYIVQNEGINERHFLTAVFLIVLGFFTFLKPLNDLPIAGIVGILVSSFICFLLVILIPDSLVVFIAGYINPKIVLAIIFLIIFAIVGLIVKFWVSGIMFLSKILSWPPIAFLISIFCFFQGLLLLTWGVSILP